MEKCDCGRYHDPRGLGEDRGVAFAMYNALRGLVGILETRRGVLPPNGRADMIVAVAKAKDSIVAYDGLHGPIDRALCERESAGNTFLAMRAISEKVELFANELDAMGAFTAGHQLRTEVLGSGPVVYPLYKDLLHRAIELTRAISQHKEKVWGSVPVSYDCDEELYCCLEQSGVTMPLPSAIEAATCKCDACKKAREKRPPAR